MPYLVENLLGLTPEAFEPRLRIVRPMLPEYIDQLEVHRLRVGSATADLRFKRTSQGIVVDVLKIDGQLDVLVETDHENSAAAGITREHKS